MAVPRWCSATTTRTPRCASSSPIVIPTRLPPTTRTSVSNLLRFLPHHPRIVLHAVTEPGGVAGKLRGHLPGRSELIQGLAALLCRPRGIDEVAREVAVLAQFGERRLGGHVTVDERRDIHCRESFCRG